MKNQTQTFDEYELGPFRAAWEVSDVARSGDIVEIDMVIFSKFAVYIGEGNIVYVTDPEEDSDKSGTAVADDSVTSNRVLNDEDGLDYDDEISSVSLCSVNSGTSSTSSTTSKRASNNINTDNNLNDTSSPSLSLTSSSSPMMLATQSKNCINTTTISQKRNSSPIQSQLTFNGSNSNLSSTSCSNRIKSKSRTSKNQQHSATPPPQPSIFAHNLRASGHLRGRAASTSALGLGSGSVTPKIMFPSVPSGFKCVVACAPLVEVAANYKCRINNKLPGASLRNLEPLPVEQVVERCCNMIGKEIDFHMLKYNSEYYVTKWKYDCGWSDQASIMKRAVSSLQYSQSMADKHQLLVDNINAVFSNPGINPPPPISPPGCGCHSPTGYSSPSTGGNNTARISHFFSGNLISNFNYDVNSSEYSPDSGSDPPLLPVKNIYHKTNFSVLNEPPHSSDKAL